MVESLDMTCVPLQQQNINEAARSMLEHSLCKAINWEFLAGRISETYIACMCKCCQNCGSENLVPRGRCHSVSQANANYRDTGSETFDFRNFTTSMMQHSSDRQWMKRRNAHLKGEAVHI